MKVSGTNRELETIPEAFRILDGIHTVSDPREARQVLSHINQYWDAIGALRIHAQTFTVLRNVCCQRIMLAEAFIPRAVREIVHDCCMNVYHPTNPAAFPRRSEWLRRLADDAKEKCALRRPFILNSERYLPDIIPSKDYKAQLSLFPTDTDDYRRKVADIAASVVLSWLGIPPNDFYGNLRAYFVHALLKYLGPVSLLLPETWEVYEQAPAWLLDEDYRRPSGRNEIAFRPNIMAQFIETLETSNTKRTEQEWKLLRQLQEAYKKYMLTSTVSSIYTHDRVHLLIRCSLSQLNLCHRPLGPAIYTNSGLVCRKS